MAAIDTLILIARVEPMRTISMPLSKPELLVWCYLAASFPLEAIRSIASFLKSQVRFGGVLRRDDRCFEYVRQHWTKGNSRHTLSRSRQLVTMGKRYRDFW